MTTERATAWSLTINNPTASDEESISLARQNGWKVEGQLEKGAEGTSHYQLLLRTPQVRFSAVKKAFPRAHIEVARNVAALQTYVHKEDTREGDLPTQQEQYPSLSKFWELIYDQLVLSESIVTNAKHNYADWAPRASDPLTELDWAVEELIRGGYRVEGLAVNPANRSAFKKYATALLTRCHRDRLNERRQPDKTDTTVEEFTGKSQVDDHTPDVSVPQA